MKNNPALHKKVRAGLTNDFWEVGIWCFDVGINSTYRFQLPNAKYTTRFAITTKMCYNYCQRMVLTKMTLLEIDKDVENWTEMSYIRDNTNTITITKPETYGNKDYASSVTTNADVSVFFTSTATQVDYITPINLEKNNN